MDALDEDQQKNEGRTLTQDGDVSLIAVIISSAVYGHSQSERQDLVQLYYGRYFNSRLFMSGYHYKRWIVYKSTINEDKVELGNEIYYRFVQKWSTMTLPEALCELVGVFMGFEVIHMKTRVQFSSSLIDNGIDEDTWNIYTEDEEEEIGVDGKGKKEKTSTFKNKGKVVERVNDNFKFQHK